MHAHARLPFAEFIDNPDPHCYPLEFCIVDGITFHIILNFSTISCLFSLVCQIPSIVDT
jgi:hypothetical protein